MMEVENMMSSTITSTVSKEEEEEDDVSLPGFRFHPTDEELVGFYLRRKVEKRPIRLDLIKLVDIYKFDPWDLPRESKGAGEKEKEWYFFCKRGRKYKNSVRPNRVTRSGFWKATGIDRPIYSTTRDCIGLKKSLVYYRGSAGKGTKTDWMMHEFRLPTAQDKNAKSPLLQEAEVWTLCRILKRSVSYRKCVPDWREMMPSNNKVMITDASSQTCSAESDQNNININGQSNSSSSSYNIISFMRAPDPPPHKITHHHAAAAAAAVAPLATQVQQYHQYGATSPSFVYGDINDFLRHADWEDLRSVVDCAAAATPSSYSLSQSQQYY